MIYRGLPDRPPDGSGIREAGGLDLFFRAHGVRHGSRMLDERLAVAEADGQRAQIFSGEIAAGQPLPSYRFMSRKYKVNVATVEKAYDLLEANGYIRRCQGSGCYVLRWIISSSLPTAWCSTVFRPGSRRPGRSMILPPARRWRRGRRRGNLSRWPTSSRSSGRMRSCAIRRHAGAAAASGRAQHRGRA